MCSAKVDGLQTYCKACLKEYRVVSRDRRIERMRLYNRRPSVRMRRMVKDAQARATRQGLAFDLDEDWVFEMLRQCEARCVYLGIELSFSDGKPNTSPSIDRIRPELGYLKSNCVVCSWRANDLKGNGTPEEHSLLAESLSLIAK